MNHVWSYDIVADQTEDGRQLKLLVVIDEYTRECLAIEADRSFTAPDVIGVLQYLFAVRGTPEHVRSDNGPEFVAKSVVRWLHQASVVRCSLPRAALGRMVTWRASTESCVMSCSTGSCS